MKYYVISTYKPTPTIIPLKEYVLTTFPNEVKKLDNTHKMASVLEKNGWKKIETGDAILYYK